MRDISYGLDRALLHITLLCILVHAIIDWYNVSTACTLLALSVISQKTLSRPEQLGAANSSELSIGGRV